jgi:hypothetical protein
MMSNRSQRRHADVYATTASVAAGRVARAIAVADRVDQILATKPEDHEAWRRVGWLRESLGIK